MPETMMKMIMFSDVISVSPNDTVEHGMSLLKKHGLRVLPVVDENETFLGMFSSREVLEHLVPLAGFLGESLGFAVGAAPDLAEKLKDFYPLKIEKFMETSVAHVKPNTHTWEALRSIVKHGSPLPVVDHENNNKLLGLVSEQSAVETLVSLCQK